MSLDAIKKAKKEGRLIYGIKRVLHAVQTGKAELVIVAANAPEQEKQQLEKRAGTIPIETITLRNVELGTLCKESFPISFLTIQKAF